MADENPQGGAAGGAEGPIVFAYDGSELADYAIAQAGRQLAPGQDCLVLCVWQTSDVGFVPVDGRKLHAFAPEEVRSAAQATAARGVLLAERAGFHAHGMEVEAAPSWKGIVEVAEERDASLIVLGSHQRSGLVGHLTGSVAAATVSHTCISVLVIHRRS